MKTYWENNGEADAQGQFAAVIDLEDGSGVQRFIGASEKEVADKLLQAQANATAKIRQQEKTIRENITPDPAKPAIEFKKRPLTADERFRVANDITDPSKSAEAIKTVVEAEVGAPLDVVRERLAADEEARQAKEAYEEAIAFANETEDYQPIPHNGDTMARYMQLNGMAPTRKNYAIAWDALKAAGLVVVKKPGETPTPEGGLPSQPEPAQPASGLPAQPSVTTRPRGVESSTGIRNADSSGTPTTRTPTPKYTRQQIEAMPMNEYRWKLSHEPGFAQLVDSLK